MLPEGFPFHQFNCTTVGNIFLISSTTVYSGVYICMFAHLSAAHTVKIQTVISILAVNFVFKSYIIVQK